MHQRPVRQPGDGQERRQLGDASPGPVLDDGQRKIDVYHIQSIHSNDTLIAYLPAEKILFVSDLFNPGLFPADRPAPYLWGFNAGRRTSSTSALRVFR